MKQSSLSPLGASECALPFEVHRQPHTHTHQFRRHSLRVLQEEKYRYPPTQCLYLRISEDVSGWHWFVTLPYLKFYLVNGGLKRKSENFSSSIKHTVRIFLNIYFLIMDGITILFQKGNLLLNLTWQYFYKITIIVWFWKFNI